MTAAVREEVRRVVLAGERDRLRRRPGDLERERERERVWKPAVLWGEMRNLNIRNNSGLYEIEVDRIPVWIWL